MVILEGSDVNDFWVTHPLGYLEFQLVDEEEEIADDYFLESPRQEIDGHVSGEDANAPDEGTTNGNN